MYLCGGYNSIDYWQNRCAWHQRVCAVVIRLCSNVVYGGGGLYDEEYVLF
jgi:hypothetical protein